MKPNKVGISLSNESASVLLGVPDPYSPEAVASTCAAGQREPKSVSAATRVLRLANTGA